MLAAQHRHAEAKEQLTHGATAWRDHYGSHHPRTITAETELNTLLRP